MAIIAGVGLVAALIAVIVLMRYSGTLSVAQRDANGQIVRRRSTYGEANQVEQELRKRAEERLARQADRRMRTRPPQRLPGPQTEPTSQQAPEPPAVRELPVDEKIASLRWSKIPTPGATHGGLIVGTIRNLYGHGIKELLVTPQVLDAEHRPIATLATVTCRHVPARGDARYSVSYVGVASDQIEGVRLSTQCKPLERPAVCYEAEVFAFDRRANTIVLTGSARNLGTKTLSEVWVYCELFTRDGEYVGSVQGKLDEVFGGRISPGRKATFEVVFDLSKTSVWPDTITLADARVVGKEE
ncbi:MAG TPA: FxLYD domain-containing protein [Phycisphaerae bacterium]|nr:FxLYD domain-containing protein [Phycisphaerae bacterium]